MSQTETVAFYLCLLPFVFCACASGKGLRVSRPHHLSCNQAFDAFYHLVQRGAGWLPRMRQPAGRWIVELLAGECMDYFTLTREIIPDNAEFALGQAERFPIAISGGFQEQKCLLFLHKLRHA